MAKINWLAIRTDYLAGETDLTALGKKHGTNRVTIWRRMTKDAAAGSEWATIPHHNGDINKMVADGIADTLQQLGRAGGIVLDNLQRHNEIETLQLDITIDSLKALKDVKLVDDKGVLDVAAVQARKSALDASVKVLESSRLVHGIPTDMPSVRITKSDDETKPDNGIEIRQRRLEPIKLAIGENGLKTG